MATPKKQSLTRMVWRQFRRNGLAVLALVLITLLGLIAVFAPFLAGSTPIYAVIEGQTYVLPNVITYDALLAKKLYANFDRWKPGEGEYALRPPIPYGPDEQDLFNRLKPPSKEHWLGTDNRGRDVLARMIWGTRISMSVGFIAVGIAALIGITLGALAGFYRGWADVIVLRLIEIMLTLPTFFLILTVVALLPPSIYLIMIVIGITTWPGFARLVRGEVLKQRELQYVYAAEASGLPAWRVLFRHVLPNAISPVFVAATFGVAGAILTESALAFLGFGVPPPTPSWGELLNQSRSYVDFAWWLVTFPGVAIFLTVTAFNLVGDGLRDSLDPRLRQ